MTRVMSNAHTTLNAIDTSNSQPRAAMLRIAAVRCDLVRIRPSDTATRIANA
jgi:hypothetical protein